MAVKVLELHHHGIRVGPTPADVKKAFGFYHDVLGLDADQGRPTIPTIDGYWMDVGGTAQIHLMGVDGASKFAQGPDKDPSRPHVALAVAALKRILDSPFGAVLQAIRENPDRATACGYDIARIKHLSFVFYALFA
ncbi:MAG: hypothetical protein ACHQ7H_10735, partial [Candidatus Rokuibacteriota bacterium]